MKFIIATLWFERKRYLPAVLAVAFSALLVTLQIGLLIGTFSMVSIPIDHGQADLWIAGPGVLSIDLGVALPAAWRSRLGDPDIESFEEYIQGFAQWRRPDGSTELVAVVGSQLHSRAMGAVAEIESNLRTRLTQKGEVAIDTADLGRLSATGTGHQTEINGKRVHVTGLTEGLKGLAGPYVFCSLETARRITGLPGNKVSFFLAKCHPGIDPGAVAKRMMARRPDMLVLTRAQFSWRSQRHWLTSTGGGAALLFAAVLGLLVGAVVTAQTLAAATAASAREFAVLRALGAPRWRIGMAVLGQSLVVAVIGLALAIPASALIAPAAGWFGARALVPLWLVALSAGVTLATGVASGMLSLRALRQAEPAMLLR